MIYHIARNNQQLGQFSKEDTLSRYNRGEILPADLVWTEGMATWQPASQVFGAPVAPATGGFTVPVAPPHVPPPAFTGTAAPQYAAPGNNLSSPPPKPDNNLAWAIVVTILCCWPLGIPAIVFAAQVDGKYFNGDYAGAAESARKSRVFMWWALGIGLLFLALYIPFLIMSGVLSLANR